MSTIAMEVGRTVRLAINTWGRTVRLMALLVLAALAGAAFLAVYRSPLIAW